jgi:hypothetical protein
MVFGVTGRADGPTGIGVQGLSERGIGIWGAGGRYGTQLEGDLAPLRLTPGGDVGAPSNGHHQVGELYVDAKGALFSVTRAAPLAYGSS